MAEEAKIEENTAGVEAKPDSEPAEGGDQKTTEQETTQQETTQQETTQQETTQQETTQQESTQQETAEQKTKEDAAETPSEEVQPAGSETPAESEQSKPETESEKVEGKGEEVKDDKPTEIVEGLEEVKVISGLDAETVGGRLLQKKSYISDSLMKFYKYMGLSQEEGEETHKVIKEVEKIDRAPYYERYEVLSKEIEDERVNNNVTQRKLVQFFKKKRMDHVLKESSDQYDGQQKYNQKLDAYGELIEIDARERNAITSELTDLKEKRDSKYHELIALFEEMQRKEKETGTGLINTQTGKTISDKLVDRLIRLQESQMQTINTMRLKYIRLKDLVVEKQNYIAILDKIDDDLYLKDYEQLEIENRGLEDKIEERDEELSKLRSKYHSNIQILAHVREKSTALDSDIDNLKDEIDTIEEESVKV